MRIFGFGMREKPKVFTYVPQFYDERKERLESMLEDANAVDEAGAEAMKTRIKHSLAYRPYYYDKTNTVGKARKKANIRTTVIAFILIIIVFYIAATYSPEITEFSK